MKKILSTIIYLTSVKVVLAGPLFCLPMAPGSTEGDDVEGPLCKVAGRNFHKTLTLKKKRYSALWKMNHLCMLDCY